MANSSLSGSFSTMENQFNALGTLYLWIDDLMVAWPLILLGVGISILLGLFYCYFMRCCAALITWIIIIFMLLIFWLGGWLAYNSARAYQDKIDEADKAATSSGGTADTGDDEWTRNWCYVGCGFAWFFALIFTCLVLCNFHRIRLVICIVKASGRFINNNIMILFVPIINTIIAVAWFFFWFVGIIYLYSVGKVSKNTTFVYPWSEVEWEDFTKYSFYFNLFFGLWLLAFMISLNVFVIASASVIWYFQQGDGQEEGSKSKKNPCCTGYRWALGIHMGSIAFGSFILAVVWAIQIVFLYIEKKMKDTG